MISKLNELDRLKLQLVIFMTFLIFIVVSILSYSIYLSYQNQRISEIGEIQRNIYLDIIQILDREGFSIKNLIGYNLPENTLICVSKTSQIKICIQNRDGTVTVIKNNTKLDDELIVYSNKYKDTEVFIGSSKSDLEKELKKLRISIILSDILVLALSAFLSFSVFGRLLSPIKTRIDKLNQTLKIVSHDIRTPISVIDTNLYLIKSKEECKSTKIINIEKNVNYIKNLIKNIEYLTEKSPSKTEKVDVGRLLTEVIDKYSTLINQKNIKVEFKENGTFIVDGNYTDLEVLFSNLIDNAIKYNHEGGKVMVEVGDRTVYIKNTGQVIKDRKKIFEKYYREDTSGTIQGIGLGLSIVKNLCKIYNLKVDVETTDSLNVFAVSKR